MSQYLAAYDISDDSRRERAARVLLGYGERIQRSVFIVLVEPDELGDLKRELGAVLSVHDRFVLFPIERGRGRSTVIWQKSLVERDPVLIL